MRGRTIQQGGWTHRCLLPAWRLQEEPVRGVNESLRSQAERAIASVVEAECPLLQCRAARSWRARVLSLLRRQLSRSGRPRAGARLQALGGPLDEWAANGWPR